MKRSYFLHRLEKHITDIGYHNSFLDEDTLNVLLALMELEGMLPPKRNNGKPGDLTAYEWEDENV